MPQSRGVHAWIEVDGVQLPEYNPQGDQRRTTCFIPSEEGKKFCVRFQNSEPAMTALRANIFLDGLRAGSGLLLPTDAQATTISGQSRWEGLECPFQFSKLRTTDDESEACQDEDRLRELGTIRVQIEWVVVLRQEPWRPPLSVSTSSNEPVYERIKKAGAHCASFGNLEVSRPKHWYSTSKIPFIEPTEFVFQYAPQAWLEAKNIATPPSVPATSSSKRRRESITESNDSEHNATELLDEEEAAVYRRLKAKLAARQSCKRKKAVKSEPRDSGTASSLCEVIDLTGDD